MTHKKSYSDLFILNYYEMFNLYVCLLQIFIFGGRLIFGPDARSLFVTVSLIVVPVVIFCVFVARHLLHRFHPHNAGYAVLVVAIAFTIYVSTLFACLKPGTLSHCFLCKAL